MRISHKSDHGHKSPLAGPAAREALRVGDHFGSRRRRTRLIFFVGNASGGRGMFPRRRLTRFRPTTATDRLRVFQIGLPACLPGHRRPDRSAVAIEQWARRGAFIYATPVYDVTRTKTAVTGIACRMSRATATGIRLKPPTLRFVARTLWSGKASPPTGPRTSERSRMSLGNLVDKRTFRIMYLARIASRSLTFDCFGLGFRATCFDGDLHGTFHRIFEGHLDSEQSVLVGRFGFVRFHRPT